MNTSKWMAGALAGAMAVSVYVRAEETTPADKPETKMTETETKKEAKPAKALNFLPYKLMSSLTDEQKAKIAEVHQKYIDERKKLEEAETAEITALLTEEQKAEIKQIEEKRAADKKTKDAEKKDMQKKEAKEEAKPE